MDEYLARVLQITTEEQKRKDRLLRLLFLCGPPSDAVTPPDTVNNLTFETGNNVTFEDSTNATVIAS